MKRVLAGFLFIGSVLILCACMSEREMAGMPKYNEKECHYGEGFQDYTDYCKYSYDEDSVKAFETHKKFKSVTASDIENIKSYFENFESWVEFESYYDKYDFDLQTQIKVGDYFYIKTKEGKKIGDGVLGKFDSYDVYYVDMSKRILYYIHSNT